MDFITTRKIQVGNTDKFQMPLSQEDRIYNLKAIKVELCQVKTADGENQGIDNSELNAVDITLQVNQFTMFEAVSGSLFTTNDTVELNQEYNSRTDFNIEIDENQFELKNKAVNTYYVLVTFLSDVKKVK